MLRTLSAALRGASSLRGAPSQHLSDALLSQAKGALACESRMLNAESRMYLSDASTSEGPIGDVGATNALSLFSLVYTDALLSCLCSPVARPIATTHATAPWCCFLSEQPRGPRQDCSSPNSHLWGARVARSAQAHAARGHAAAPDPAAASDKGSIATRGDGLAARFYQTVSVCPAQEARRPPSSPPARKPARPGRRDWRRSCRPSEAPAPLGGSWVLAGSEPATRHV